MSGLKQLRWVGGRKQNAGIICMQQVETFGRGRSIGNTSYGSIEPGVRKREVSHYTIATRTGSKHTVGAVTGPHPAVALKEYSVLQGLRRDDEGPNGDGCCWQVIVTAPHG